MKKTALCILTLLFILLTACVSQATQEMRHRQTHITSAIASPGDQIVLVGDVSTSRTGIAFSLENLTAQTFNYGAAWDLAYYTNGTWRPVSDRPESFGWILIGYWLKSGEIQQYQINWSWRFGELPPGRYMYIRGGWLGEDWNPDSVYALVEFTITADCHTYLP